MGAQKTFKTHQSINVSVSYLEDKAGLAFDLDTVTLEYYDTQQECLDAVAQGEADAVLCDGYLSEYLMGTELSYSNLEIKNVINGEHHVAIAVRSDQIQLAGILNKITDTIDARQVSEYMLESNVLPASLPRRVYRPLSWRQPEESPHTL